MNCANWEERIALNLGGDLPAVEAAQVERHLVDCAGCQVFAGEIRESLALLREAHTEDPGPAAYAAVRARVLAQLEPRRSWRWFFALASAAAIVVLLVAIWPRPAARMVVSKIATPVPPVVEQPAVVPAKHVLHRRKPAVRLVRTALPATPLVVKMVTDDPDVVIYWISDTRGE